MHYSKRGWTNEMRRLGILGVDGDEPGPPGQSSRGPPSPVRGRSKTRAGRAASQPPYSRLTPAAPAAGMFLPLSRRLRSGNQEGRNTSVCPSQENFHTVVLKGVRNISDTL